MATPSSASSSSWSFKSKDSGRVVAAIDFGTTFSGHAHIHRSEPEKVHKLYDWPQSGGSSYCKTLTCLLYERRKDNPGIYKLKEWGWPALMAYTDAARSLRCINPTMSSGSMQSGSGAMASARADARPRVLSEAGYLARNFKLGLSRDQGLADLAHSLPGNLTVERLISDYLRCMAAFIFTDLQIKYGKQFSMQQVEWCLTVPAIWDERAKQVMKVCAEKAGLVCGPLCPSPQDASPHELGIILEPEAASMYCQYHARAANIHLRKHDKLLVADVGGGTIDLVVHAKAESSPESVTVDEVVSSYGCLGGGSFVDMAFFAFLSARIGCFEAFCRNNPYTQLNISRWWQGVKVGFDGPGYRAFLDISKSLSDAWMAYDERMGATRSEDEYAQVVFKDTDLMAIFDPEVEKVLGLIQKQVEGVRVLMVVGGFSSSRYLRRRIVQRFQAEVEEIITPDDPGSAICHGAALLHLRKEIVQSRISKRTYGIKTTRVGWQPDDPPQFKFTDDDGEQMCSNVIDCFVHVGERVVVGSKASRSFCPVYHKQSAMEIELYSSTEMYPKFTTDEGCTLEGSFVVDLSADMELGKERDVEVILCFGASTIQVTAMPQNFGDLHDQVELGLPNVSFVAATLYT